MAKKHAAEAMVIELQKLPPLPSQQPSPPQSGRRVGRVSKRSIPNSNNLATAVPAIPPRRRKPKNLIKEFVSNDDTSTTSTSATEDEVTNPISRLLRMQQAARKREPIYTVIEERGQAKRKEFVVEVECNDEKAQGIGPNKKLAKRTAAENYLIKMGLLTPEASEVDSTKSPPGGKVQRRVIFKEPETPIVQTSPGGSAGRQLVPGVLLMNSPDNLGNAKCTSTLYDSMQSTFSLFQLSKRHRPTMTLDRKQHQLMHLIKVHRPLRHPIVIVQCRRTAHAQIQRIQHHRVLVVAFVQSINYCIWPNC